jgi:copper homeostasis protein
LTRLEVIATSLADARAAAEGGADSLEICVDLPADGLTPPLPIVQAIRDAVAIELNVMVRPHDAGFVYAAAARDAILASVAQFKPLGIQSLVFGAHRPDGTLDIALIRQIAAAADPVPLTVHRALEWSTHPADALPQLVGVVPRILTSGPAPSAPAGVAGLRDWVARFGEHFRFVAAGGIRLANIRRVAETGVDVCHVGSAARLHDQVDTARVRALVAALSDG